MPRPNCALFAVTAFSGNSGTVVGDRHRIMSLVERDGDPDLSVFPSLECMLQAVGDELRHDQRYRHQGFKIECHRVGPHDQTDAGRVARLNQVHAERL